MNNGRPLAVERQGVSRRAAVRLAGKGFAIGAMTLMGLVLGAQTRKPEMFPLPNVTHGKQVFEQKCAICHYAASEAMKIGPGLKAFSKRGSFTGTKGKVLDESLKSWIESGDAKMPPMKANLDAAELRDVIAYVKTL